MPSAKFLTFAGSNRRGSYNAMLANAVGEALKAHGEDVSMLTLADYPMPIMDEDLETREGQPASAIALAKLFVEAKGIFIANPEYNSTITPLVKNTLDWLSRVKNDDGGKPPVFTAKAFAIGGASPGKFGGVRAIGQLRQLLEIGLGALVIPEQVLVSRAREAFSPEGQLIDEISAKMLDRMVKRLIREANHAADD